jgi:hypothetical protein
MGVEEDEEIDGAVATIIVIEAFGPSRRGRDWPARFADEIASTAAMNRPSRVSASMKLPSAEPFLTWALCGVSRELRGSNMAHHTPLLGRGRA